MRYNALILGSFFTFSYLFVSCEDDLTVTPETSRTTVDFYKSAEDIEFAVNAVYGGLQRNDLYGWSYHFVMEERADNTGEQFLQSDMDQFIRNTSNSHVANVWKGSYLTIQAANTVLNRIDGVNDIGEEIREARKGEMKFIRALLYYNLVNLYGNVPLVVEETTNPNNLFGQGRASIEEVSNQIIKDLLEAQEELPITNEVGRANEDAASALLGKVYLMTERYAEAEEVLRNVIDPGKWTETYAELFGVENENNKSSLFEIQFASNINGETEGSRFATRFRANGNPGSKGQNIITSEFLEAFQEGDIRKNEIIPDLNTENPVVSTKYSDLEANPDDGGNNVIVLRYADVLLMLAEALNAQGYVPDGEAFELVNTIRSRAGLPNINARNVIDKDSFKEVLLQERRFEFFYELHRWFDLKRLGDPVAVMNAHFSTIGRNIIIDRDDLLLPIPQSQIDTDPDHMEQNSGY